MSAGRVRARALAALVGLFALLPQAAPLALVAAARGATTAPCGCNGRMCCCSPKKAGGAAAPCHGVQTRKPTDPAAPRWRCHHTLPGLALTSRPVLLAAQAPRHFTPPGTPVPTAPSVLTLDGFARLDAPPPRPLSTLA